MSVRPVKAGDVIRTRRHKRPILVRGCNRCHPEIIWGEDLVNGKPDKHTWKCFTQGEVIALESEAGMQMLLAGD